MVKLALEPSAPLTRSHEIADPSLRVGYLMSRLEHHGLRPHEWQLATTVPQVIVKNIYHTTWSCS